VCSTLNESVQPTQSLRERSFGNVACFVKQHSATVESQHFAPAILQHSAKVRRQLAWEVFIRVAKAILITVILS